MRADNRLEGKLYRCDHPVYNRCTLFERGAKGLCVVQQRYDPTTKVTWWTEPDQYIVDAISLCGGFKHYFDAKASRADDMGLYPTVTTRQIMEALRMKTKKKERWEVMFDRGLL